MPNNLPRLEKAIKRIIWEQKHEAPNESQNYVQWLQKIDVFFTGLTAIASVGSLLGIAFYYGLNNSTNEASGFLVGLHCSFILIYGKYSFSQESVLLLIDSFSMPVS